MLCSSGNNEAYLLWLQLCKISLASFGYPGCNHLTTELLFRRKIKAVCFSTRLLELNILTNYHFWSFGECGRVETFYAFNKDTFHGEPVWRLRKLIQRSGWRRRITLLHRTNLDKITLRWIWKGIIGVPRNQVGLNATLMDLLSIQEFLLKQAGFYEIKTELILVLVKQSDETLKQHLKVNSKHSLLLCNIAGVKVTNRFVLKEITRKWWSW